MSAFITCNECGATLECKYSQNSENKNATLFVTADWDGNVYEVYVECGYCGATEVLEEAEREPVVETDRAGSVHIDEALTKLVIDYNNSRDPRGISQQAVDGPLPQDSKWTKFRRFMTKQRGTK